MKAFPDHPALLHEKSSEMFGLRKRLLENGGREVLFPAEESNLDELSEWGRIFSKQYLRHCEMGECYQSNSASLWYHSKGRTQIITGYALDADGVWRQHCWGFRDTKIIETTSIRRGRYFGIELDCDQSMTLACEHLDKYVFVDTVSRNAALLGFV